MKSAMAWLGIAVGIVWLVGGAFICARTWPSIPLDLSPGDPATRAAFAHAVTIHALRCALVTLGPPLVLLAVWLGLRTKRPRP
jgi:hypothetical protein